MADEPEDDVGGADPDASSAGDSSETVTADQPAESRPGLPLFYREPRPLDISRHGGKSLKMTRDLSFAAPSNSVPITIDEFVVSARHYPIVFTPDQPTAPVAVLGLRRAENLFIDSSGGWADGLYIPGYVRRYPFIFIEHPDTKQFALCIDEASDLLEDGDARPLFENQEPSPITKRALEFCTAYHRQFSGTRRFTDALEEADLLIERTANITVPGGQQLGLQGTD